MVDVGHKPTTERAATATGQIVMQPETLQRILDRGFKKGDVLEVARLAGIMAAKKTPDLIPLCHPLMLTSVTLDWTVVNDTTLQVSATVKVFAQTGVEMEALTAVSVAALTVYDMCKGIDRTMTIGLIELKAKSGGQSSLPAPST